MDSEDCARETTRAKVKGLHDGQQCRCEDSIREAVQTLLTRCCVATIVVVLCSGEREPSTEDLFRAQSHRPTMKLAVAGHTPNQEVSDKMTTEQITQRIRAKDWTVVEQPGVIGPESAPAIAVLLDDEDNEVRELTVHALHQADGPAGADALIRALDDANDMVRGAACRFLQHHVKAEHLNVLLPRLSGHEDEYVREHVALAVGRLGQTTAIRPLKARAQVEDRVHAKKAISLALARLGDEEHRQAYVARLEQDDPTGRAAALDDLIYLDDRKLIPHVRPLLDDRRDAKNVGPSHGPFWIRVCDVAINVLDEVLDHPFPFEITGAKRYSAEEIERARASIP